MDEKLKKLKIERDKKYGIGKKIGNKIWFHKKYIKEIMSYEKYSNFLSIVPVDFIFNIIRWDEKNQEMAFIYSEDFNTSKEPQIGTSIKVKEEKNKTFSIKISSPPKDPLIYHHKWLFVKDDYSDFNVINSKKRSLEWKTSLGIDKNVTSRIGRLSFWDDWLKNNLLSPRV